MDTTSSGRVAGGPAVFGASASLDERLVSLTAPASPEAEQYRIVRHAVEQAQRDRGVRLVAVTSPSGGEGKTLTALNLAGALAQSRDARVLLVEADLRRPAVLSMLGEAAGPGLVDAVLSPKAALADFVRVRSRYNLSVLAAGSPARVAYEILRSPRVEELLAQARAAYDYVVLDTPPAVPCPDYRLIEKWVDGTVLVVAAHRTPRRMVEAAVHLVDPAKGLGIVFNGDDSPRARYGGYYTERPERVLRPVAARRGRA